MNDKSQVPENSDFEKFVVSLGAEQRAKAKTAFIILMVALVVSLAAGSVAYFVSAPAWVSVLASIPFICAGFWFAVGRHL